MVRPFGWVLEMAPLPALGQGKWVVAVTEHVGQRNIFVVVRLRVDLGRVHPASTYGTWFLFVIRRIYTVIPDGDHSYGEGL